jgi:ankyrin repeat protein
MKITVDQFKDASWDGNFDIVKEYVESGGDVNACASNSVNALVTFHTDILEYLYQNGADPRVVWADGNPAFCFHAWEVNLEGLKWFLEKGVDPDLAHRDTGENSLHSLTAKPRELEKRFEAIKLLVEAGANVNAKTKDGIKTGNFMRDVCVVGETPLHRAAAYQSIETIEFLLSHGADKALKDNRNESALSWASRHWRPREILKILLYGPYENSIR